MEWQDLCVTDEEGVRGVCRVLHVAGFSFVLAVDA